MRSLTGPVQCFIVAVMIVAISAVRPPAASASTAESLNAFLGVAPGAARIIAGNFVHGRARIRGAAAATSLSAGDVVLRVPADRVLSRVHPDIVGFFGAGGPGSTGATNWRLVCTLATERRLGETSPWSPFLQSLPSLEELQRSHPLWAGEGLLQRFAALPLVEKAREVRKQLDTFQNAWEEFLWEFDAPEWRRSGATTHARQLRGAARDVGRDDVAWAFTVVMTRSFASTQGPRLAPLADFLNTAPPEHQNVAWKVLEDGGLELRATRAVARNGELLTTYGDRDEDSAALEWGFVRSWQKSRHPPLPLNASACASLATERSKLTSATGCRPAASETQPQIFCLLARLAQDHCSGQPLAIS